MPKSLKFKTFRDFSKGNWQSIQNSITPENSVKLAINLDSDVELGSLVLRNGTTLINAQLSDTYPCLGLHNFRASLSSVNKLFAVFADGSNNDIYDVVAGTKSLADDTKNLKTRFLTYLDACLRLNGTDSPKFFNGTSWHSVKTGANFTAATNDTITSNSHGLLNGDIVTVSSSTTLPAGLSATALYYVVQKADNTFKVSLTYGGTEVDITDTGTGTHTWTYWDPFDISNIPSGSKYAVEFKDKVFVAGRTDYPDRVDISGISSSTLRTVSWTSGNTFINFEQEDGGGGITALAKVPGYVLVFKKRTLKRWDGSTAYPEDMINQGAPSQESMAVAKGICFWVNENGCWATTGGEPKKISTFRVDNIIKSCSAANLANVAAGTDEEHISWSFASVTMSGETYTNVVLKYNILQDTWDIRKYATLPRVFAKYVDASDDKFTVFGDDDGNVQKMNIGTTDNTAAIAYSLETYDIDFGYRMFKKIINRFGIFSEHIVKASVMWRNSHNPEDWETIGTIENNDVAEFSQLSLTGNYFNLKITESTDTGQAKILGIEFPEGSVNVYENVE